MSADLDQFRAQVTTEIAETEAMRKKTQCFWPRCESDGGGGACNCWRVRPEFRFP